MKQEPFSINYNKKQKKQPAAHSLRVHHLTFWAKELSVWTLVPYVTLRARGLHTTWSAYSQVLQ